VHSWAGAGILRLSRDLTEIALAVPDSWAKPLKSQFFFD
jgi:hypothetical protein